MLLILLLPYFFLFFFFLIFFFFFFFFFGLIKFPFTVLEIIMKLLWNCHDGTILSNDLTQASHLHVIIVASGTENRTAAGPCGRYRMVTRPCRWVWQTIAGVILIGAVSAYRKRIQAYRAGDFLFVDSVITAVGFNPLGVLGCDKVNKRAKAEHPRSWLRRLLSRRRKINNRLVWALLAVTSGRPWRQRYRSLVAGCWYRCDWYIWKAETAQRWRPPPWCKHINTLRAEPRLCQCLGRRL